MISPDILALFLYGSVLFCWLFIFIVTSGAGDVAHKINNPGKQLYICSASAVVVVALATGLTVGYRFFPSFMPKLAPDSLGMIIANAMVLFAICGALFMGDKPESTGITIKNIHTLLVFAGPPAALLLFPGGLLNLRLIEKQMSVDFIMPIFAEEFFFRGFLQTRLRANFGPLKGLLAAAVVATLFKIIPLAFTLSPPALIGLGVGYFVVFGLAAGHIFARTGNIFSVVAFHAFIAVAPIALANLSIQ